MKTVEGRDALTCACMELATRSLGWQYRAAQARIWLTQLPYNWLQSLSKVKRVFRRAIDTEAQDMRDNFGLFEDKPGDRGPTGTQLLMFWPAIGKDDDCRLSRHLDDMCVVLGTDGVVNFSQAFLIGAAISECVRHDDATIPPRLCKPATLGDGRIIEYGICDAGIHQNEQRLWLVVVPQARKAVTIFLILPTEMGRAGNSVVQGETNLATGTVGWRLLGRSV